VFSPATIGTQESVSTGKSSPKDEPASAGPTKSGIAASSHPLHWPGQWHSFEFESGEPSSQHDRPRPLALQQQLVSLREQQLSNEPKAVCANRP